MRRILFASAALAALLAGGPVVAQQEAAQPQAQAHTQTDQRQTPAPATGAPQGRQQMGAREDEGQQQNQGAARAGGDQRVGFVADNGGEAPDQKAGALTPDAIDKDIEEGRTQHMFQRRAQGADDGGPSGQLDEQTAAAYPATANNLIGQDAYSGTNEDVGDVSDVLVDDQGRPIAVVIDHGGWLGLGEKQIAIDWDQLTVTPEGVRVKMPSDQISQLPEYEGDIQ